MKLNGLLFAFALSLVLVLVESGVVLDKIHEGRQRLRCGLRRFHDRVRHRPDVGCDNQYASNENDNEFGNKQNIDGGHQSTFRPSTGPGDRRSTLNVGFLSTSTERTYATVPGGKTVIRAKANCGEGYRDDGHGNCREDY